MPIMLRIAVSAAPHWIESQTLIILAASVRTAGSLVRTADPTGAWPQGSPGGQRSAADTA